MAAWPLGALAQSSKRPVRIGLLPFGSPSNAYDQSLVDAFRSGLRHAGLTEGQDIVLDVIWLRRHRRHRDPSLPRIVV